MGSRYLWIYTYGWQWLYCFWAMYFGLLTGFWSRTYWDILLAVGNLIDATTGQKLATGFCSTRVWCEIVELFFLIWMISVDRWKLRGFFFRIIQLGIDQKPWHSDRCATRAIDLVNCRKSIERILAAGCWLFIPFMSIHWSFMLQT